MTDNGSQEKPPTDESAEAEVAEAPAPEPMTPARVLEWNAYYDIYVALFVVLLVFLGSANKIQTLSSGIFSMLQAGRQTIENRAPVVTDNSSIAAGNNQRWVNIPWLFEVAHYGLYSAGASVMLPSEPKILEGTTPQDAARLARSSAIARAAAQPKAEQVGVGTMIAVDAVVRALAALLLLGLRRKGPGLWWSAICVTIALGVTLGASTSQIFSPGSDGEVVTSYESRLDMQLGGIALIASVVSPETWGLFFAAVELLLLHQALNLGKTGRLYALIPLFLVWANSDSSFAFGLIVLAASVLGQALDARRDPSARSPRSGLIALGLSFAVCFINPSHVLGVLAAFGTTLKIFSIQGGPPSPEPTFLFGEKFTKGNPAEIVRSLRLYYSILVGIGLASFALNRRKFALGRFLPFVVIAALWGLAFKDYTWIFALVLTSSLALNGQEWYQRTFGVEGKMGLGWSIWSTGGRVVTIAVVFLAIARGVTGWGNSVGDFQFGFGFNPDDFPFEAASRLLDAPIEGNILNTTLAQGDAIAWKALAKHKAFVDSRRHLYPFSIFEELDAVRRDLKNDDIARWQPILDKFNISVVMIQLIGDKHDAAPFTYVKLMQSPNWVPFYDDGAVVMFGRADDKARPSDLAYFKANRLDAELLAYKQPSLVPSWQRTPIATSDFLDRIFQNRVLNRPQPHDDAAERWLRPISTQLGKPSMVTPANCLMAIREARTALSIKPDDTIAFQRLFEAYRILIAEESALIQGIPLTPENARRIDQSPPQTRLLANRMRQLVTVLNFRISTLPPPKTTEEFAERASLNFTLAQVYGQIGALDLARDRLQEVVKDATQSKMKLDFLKNVTNQIGELNEQLRKMEAQLEKDTLTYRLGPMDRAGFLRANGAPGQAIKELDEANSTGARLAGILPTLVDCYCDVGQPDKAFDVIYDLDPDSDKLSNAPGQASAVGTAAYRQGLVFLLLGSYDNVFSLWRDEAINKLQTQRSLQGPSAGQMLLIGEPVASTRMLLELPEKANTQAQWEFELGLATLEGGFPPDVAAEHFETALKLEPNLTVRPLIAYYLEKLGKPVPPPKIATPKPVEPATPPAQPDELPKDVFEPEPTKP